MTVIDVFTKYAWTAPSLIKAARPMTNCFKTILLESRKTVKISVDRSRELYYKTFKFLSKERETESYSTYNDLKAVLIEKFNETFSHIIIKTMFII